MRPYYEITFPYFDKEALIASSGTPLYDTTREECHYERRRLSGYISTKQYLRRRYVFRKAFLDIISYAPVKPFLPSKPCRDSQGTLAPWHACEHCGYCHILDCHNRVKLCEPCLDEIRDIQNEMRAERMNEEALYGYELEPSYFELYGTNEPLEQEQ